MAKRITIRRPDDMHAHLRDGAMLEAVARYTARDFARAIVMPNLAPAVKTVADAKAYYGRIREAVVGQAFTPLMTLYLTEETSLDTIRQASEAKMVHAIKYYPHGATTNSAEGVRSFANVSDQLEAMQECGLPLLLHGEITHDASGESVDPFYRERRFIEEVLPELRKNYPKLRIVLEHITTKEAASLIAAEGGPTLAATITPHHLLVDRRALFEGGLNPHFYCLPILKESEDLEALRALATSGNRRVFAGTDTAPHPTHAKERACGCAAGCFVAPVALSAYAQVFEDEDRFDNLEAFLSENGANWYGLPLNEGTVTLVRFDDPHRSTMLTEVGESLRDAVRTFGMHSDAKKSMKWHWRVLR